MTTVPITRYVGFCPICEGDYKLAPKPGVINDDRHAGMALVHHGYRRPGGGYIVGDCYGVGWQPYELTTLVCEAWRDKMQDWQDATERTLARLESPELETLYGTTRWLFPKALTQRASAKQRYHFDKEAAYYDDVYLWVRWDGNQEEQLLFSRWRCQYIADAQRDIATARSEVARMNKLIAAWVLAPVRTELEAIEQDKAKRKAERADREAALQAKRDAKAAKRRGLDEKKARWEAEKQALIEKYRQVFRDLACSPENANKPAVRYAAMDFWRVMNKESSRKGYLHFYARELQIDESLIALGLAVKVERPNGTYVQHALSSGYLPLP